MRHPIQLLSFAILAAPAFAQEAAYIEIDEIRGARVQLASFPIRPMVIVPALGGRPETVWAVNQHEDLVERFPAPTAPFVADVEPNLSVHTPWDPVSVAYWPGDGGPDEVLVACRGSWGVLRLDATSGAVRGYVTLTPSDLGGIGRRGHGRMAEPGDLLVDEDTNMAFVSCTGVDAVLQIDLAQGVVVRLFQMREGEPVDDPAFRLKAPVFLSWDPRPAPSGVRRVLVAPLHSGNGTTTSNLAATGAPFVDLAANFGLTPLPDEDLFTITPWTPISNGSVDVALTSTGTILFAQGTHPQTGDHWQLNTDANNGGPQNASEPLVNGRFGVNRITVTQGFGTPTQAQVVHLLEDGGLGGTLTPDQVVGQPFGIEFGRRGRVYVCGLLTDNVMQLNRNAVLTREWDLPDGSVPRGLLTYDVGPRENLLVYCWGSNDILVYYPVGSGPLTPRSTLHLTEDSTPEEIQRGRELFFDGTRSATGSVSCATCHVECGFDLLGWDLSPKPLHSKAVMVTQTLVGIEKLGPFHWRGERDFVDFNPAFGGLLGNHDPANMNMLSAAEFQDFEAFIFSLRNPANPFQSRRRLVDASLHNLGTSLPGNAVDGQDVYHIADTVGASSCVDCHDTPTGTSSDIFPIFGGFNEPVRTNLMVPALHELWRKEQSLVNLGGGATGSRPFLGFGFSHSGSSNDLFDFLSFVQGAQGPQERSDVTDFSFEWDQGIAPAAHFAYSVDSDSVASGAAGAEAESYLERQATLASPNCDVVVIGQTDIGGGTLAPRRWFFDRSLAGGAAYRCEDAALGTRSFSDFEAGVTGAGEQHVFIGYPVGMGERIGIDRDMDGETDFDELAAGTDPYDSSDPGLPIGVRPSFVELPEVLWVNTKHARIDLETDQPTTLVVQYRELGAATWMQLRPNSGLSRVHGPLLRDLRPSTSRGPNPTMATVIVDEDVTYELRVTAVNREGRRRTSPVQTFVTDPFIIHDEFLQGGADQLTHEAQVIDRSDLVQVSPTKFQLDFSNEFKRGDQAANPEPMNRIVIGRVLVESCTNVAGPSAPPDYVCQPIQPLTLAEVLPGANTIGHQTVTMLSPSGPSPMPVGTDFLITVVPTNGTGDTTLEFDITGFALTPDDRVIFNVDAVVEVNAATWPQEIAAATGMANINVPILKSRARSQWSFPDTGEALTAPSVRIP